MAVLAAGLAIAVAAWSAQAETARAAEPVTIAAGATSQVTLPASEIVAVCEPPGAFSPNPTKWTIYPEAVRVGGTVSPPGGEMPVPGSLLSVEVPAGHSSFQTITISWTGNTLCVSYRGTLTLNVGPAAPAGSTIPAAPTTPTPPAGVDGSVAVRTCPVRIGGRAIVVHLDGEESCALARDIALSRAAGWTCAKAPLSPTRRYVICSRGGAWGVALPARGGNCTSVTHQGRRYRVVGARVRCRYARATALRMLRRDSPYAYEFVRAGYTGRWRCRIFGRGEDERGACHKLVEERWVVYFPAGS